MSKTRPESAAARPPLPSAEAFMAAPRKALALFGMSGVGKTVLARRLRQGGAWFHYSVDYRIGTRYLDEPIVDQFKREAMKSPLLRQMLLSDSVRLESNIRFENLAPLSAYIGKPGDPALGGLPFEEYLRRQRQHREAEIAAMLDAPSFMEKAEAIYGYPHFLCDTSGSLVEVVDPEDPSDPILSALAGRLIFVYLRGEAEDEEALAQRFERDPKPIYYEEAFLKTLWSDYLDHSGAGPDAADPDGFARFGFRRLIARRAPRYQRIADLWGIALHKEAAAEAAERGESAFLRLIAETLEQKQRGGATP